MRVATGEGLLRSLPELVLQRLCADHQLFVPVLQILEEIAEVVAIPELQVMVRIQEQWVQTVQKTVETFG